MKFVSHAVRLTSRTRPAAKLAGEDTARRVAKLAPRGIGSGRHMADEVAFELTSAPSGGTVRGRVVVHDKPGKVYMREFGGEIHPRPGRPLVFYSLRQGRWVTIKAPRFVRQRPGGYSQGFQPWLRKSGGIFADAVEARLRQMRGLRQNA